MTSPHIPDDLDRMRVLLGGILDGSPTAAIEAQERQGQAELLHSTVIPSRILGCSEEELTALGFKLGDKVQGDPLFRHAELPEGWRREGSDHAMSSYILDEMGRRRCSVFFKAAFYDRRAHISVDTVFAYVGDCLHKGSTPVLDDTWATREAVLVAIGQQRDRSARYLPMYEAHDDEHSRDRAAEIRAEIALCDTLAAALTVQAEAGTDGAE